MDLVRPVEHLQVKSAQPNEVCASINHHLLTDRAPSPILVMGTMPRKASSNTVGGSITLIHCSSLRSRETASLYAPNEKWMYNGLARGLPCAQYRQDPLLRCAELGCPSNPILASERKIDFFQQSCWRHLVQKKIKNMSNNNVKKKESKKFAAVESQKVAILGAIIVALVGLIGTGINAIVSYRNNLIPVQATQTAEAKLTEVAFTSKSPIPGDNSNLDDMTVLDNFDGAKFNAQNWFFDWVSDEFTYTISQNDGKACFQFVSKSATEIPIRSKFTGVIDMIEADVAVVSGEGSFGLDVWDEFEWNNLLIDSDGNVKVAYASFENNIESVYEVSNVQCCSGYHTLGVGYSGSQISYFYDGAQVLSRPSTKLPLGYGLDVRVDARSNLNSCIDEIRVRFKE